MTLKSICVSRRFSYDCPTASTHSCRSDVFVGIMAAVTLVRLFLERSSFVSLLRPDITFPSSLTISLLELEINKQSDVMLDTK